MTSNSDEGSWNGGGGDGVLRPELKTTTAARAPGDESRAAARVAKAARLGVRVTRVLGALNSLGRHNPKRKGGGAAMERGESKAETTLTWPRGPLVSDKGWG